MNTYHLKIYTPNGWVPETIKAVSFSQNRGAYYFWVRTQNDVVRDIAVYPLDKTIIESIEYQSQKDE